MFQINSIEELQNLSKQVKWQYFEKLVAWIFEQNDFKTEVSVVKSFSGQKRQYDVIAKRFENLFLIECKHWSGKRYKTSLLKKVIEEHLEKCKLFKKIYKKPVIPIIVTLMQEDIKIHNHIPIIPIDKLNTFINSFESFEGEIKIL